MSPVIGSALKFEWDRRKAATNERIHGVGFEEATTVFADRLAVIFEDEAHSTAETREIIIGHSVAQRLLLVCFAERAENLIRIFSARPATRWE